MSHPAQSAPPYGEGPLERVFDDTARTRLLRFLYDSGDTWPQYEVADEIDVTQPSVSRQKRPLIDAGLIEEQAGGIRITESGQNLVQAAYDYVDG